MNNFELWFYRMLVIDICEEGYYKYGESFFEVMRLDNNEGREGIFVKTRLGGSMFWTPSQLIEHYKEKNNERLRIRK